MESSKYNSRYDAVEYDAGLRSYLTSIYNWMFFGMLVSAGTAYFSNVLGLTAIMASGGVLFWAVIILPFVLIFAMAYLAQSDIPLPALIASYTAFVALEGMSLSVILAHYSNANITAAFLSTAIAFSGLSIWAYTTKRNLTGMGSFFLVALIGLIVVMILNAFFPMPGLSLLVNIAGVVIFAGLIAYDTQKMRDAYVHSNPNGNARLAIMYAVELYLDFLNMFLFILRLFGSKD